MYMKENVKRINPKKQSHDMKTKTEIRLKLLDRTYWLQATNTRYMDIRVILKNKKPVYYQPRRLALLVQPMVDKEVSHWINDQIT